MGTAYREGDSYVLYDGFVLIRCLRFVRFICIRIMWSRAFYTTCAREPQIFGLGRVRSAAWSSQFRSILVDHDPTAQAVLDPRLESGAGVRQFC